MPPPSTRSLERRLYLFAASRFHPGVRGFRIVDDLAHVGVEAEDLVGQSQRIECIACGAHATNKIGTAAPYHHEKRRRSMLAEMFTQSVGDRAQGLEDVRVVRLAADDEQHVGLLQPMLETDARDFLHLFVRGITTKVR